MTAIDELFEAIIKANLQQAEQLASATTVSMGHEHVLDEILSPLLDRIGNMEQAAWMNLAQGYVASKLIRRILSQYEEAVEATGSKPRIVETVVLCNAEDDCHPIGREIVSSVLRGSGWGVRDLGIDVEAPLMVDTALEVGAKVVGVSAMTYTTATNVSKVRDEINVRGLAGQLKLAVGGVAFRLDPDLVEAVGADGTCASALQAPALIRRLWDSCEGSVL